jgi:subtilisin family serine protease
MKVTVTKYLNVRVGKPSVNAPCYQYLAPGSEIEVDGQLYRGDKYDGVDTWVKDLGGSYYWSGGTNFQSSNQLPQSVNPLSSTLFNYNESLMVNQTYKATKGENTTVAIIDSGCYKHRAIKDSIINSYNVFTRTNDQNDDSGHGTFLAGIIAAVERPENKIIGIAPKSRLIIVKAIQNNQVFAQPILDALNWIDKLSTPPDIINMSFDFSPGAKSDEFFKVFQSLRKKNVCLVAAAQDGTQVYSNSIYYPANSNLFAGVGSISKKDIQPTGLNPRVNFIIPNWEFLSLRNFPGDYKTLSGSSVASAIVSGSLSLVIARNKLDGQTRDAQILLSDEAIALTHSNFDNSLKLYK